MAGSKFSSQKSDSNFGWGKSDSIPTVFFLLHPFYVVEREGEIIGHRWGKLLAARVSVIMLMIRVILDLNSKIITVTQKRYSILHSEKTLNNKIY